MPVNFCSLLSSFGLLSSFEMLLSGRENSPIIASCSDWVLVNTNN
jgi:hypothetical protein